METRQVVHNGHEVRMEGNVRIRKTGRQNRVFHA